MQGLQKDWGCLALCSGAGMLGLGMMLLGLGAYLSTHGVSAWAMALTSVLVCVGMLLPLVLMGAARQMPATRLSLVGVLLAAGVFYLAYKSYPVYVWITLSSGGLGISDPVMLWITLPAAGMGILWSLWLLRLAMTVERQGKAGVLALASGLTATLGILLALQNDITRITSLTAAACFALWIGAQILMSIPLLYRERIHPAAETAKIPNAEYSM